MRRINSYGALGWTMLGIAGALCASPVHAGFFSPMFSRAVGALNRSFSDSPGEAALANERSICRDEWTTDEPFRISGAGTRSVERYRATAGEGLVSSEPVDPRDQAKMGTEEFHPNASRDSTSPPLISRGSLVRLLEEGSAYSRVKVLSTHNQYSARMGAVKGVEFAERDDEGFIANPSVRRYTSSDLLIVTRDTRLLSRDRDGTSRLFSFPHGTALMPSTAGDCSIGSSGTCRFKVRTCPARTSSGRRVMRRNYIFSPVSYDPTRGQQVRLAAEVAVCDTCMSSDGMGLRPIPRDRYDDILGFRNLARLWSRSPLPSYVFGMDFDSDGRVRLPVGQNELVDNDLMFHYETSRESPGLDTWGEPQGVCTVMRLLSDWRRHTKSAGLKDERGRNLCRVGGQGNRCIPAIGDLSFITPTRNGNNRDPIGHKSHSTGSCFDMRPFRNDMTFAGIDWRDEAYNREITENFVRFAAERGADTIFFNDPSIIDQRSRRGVKVRSIADHDNHLHICFPLTGDFAHACTERPQSWPAGPNPALEIPRPVQLRALGAGRGR